MPHKLLDRPAYQTMQGDHGEFDKVVRAICLERGNDDYLAAVELFQDSWERARAVNGPGQTVAQVLELAGVAPAEVEAGVRLLEKRDTGLKVMLDADMRAAEPADVSVNRLGQVALAPDADVGAMMANPEEFERRLARMRAADPRGTLGAWDGDAGRQRFKDADKSHLEAGVDLVRTAERAQALATAKARNENHARQVDEEIRDAISRQAGVKALDARLAALAGEQITARAQRAAAAGDGEPAGPGRVWMLEAQAQAAVGASEGFAAEREILLDLNVDENTITQLEAHVLEHRPPVETPSAPARPDTGSREDEELAAQLAAGATIDQMGRLTPPKGV